MTAAPARVVALGASNLTRGFPMLVSAARSLHGTDVEVIAALGLGRSYGMESRVLARTLPGILQSGLWKALAESDPKPTRALVTDVGNDILYGAAPEQILEWVAAAVERLTTHTRDIVVTGLPLGSIRRLSPAGFLAFRTILFPRCRLPFARVTADAERIDEGLDRLARERGARFVPLRLEWYGLDPIHIRPASWAAAWQEILGATTSARPTWVETVRLLALPPERRRLFGIERTRAQPGTRLAAGGLVRVF